MVIGRVRLMSSRSKSLRIIAAPAAGILVWLPINLATAWLDRPGNDAWTLWYWIGYPALLLFSLFAGYRFGGGIRGPVSILASYIAALFLVPHTGNLLPFELLIMGMFAIPAAVAEGIGALLGRGSKARQGESIR